MPNAFFQGGRKNLQGGETPGYGPACAYDLKTSYISGSWLQF